MIITVKGGRMDGFEIDLEEDVDILILEVEEIDEDVDGNVEDLYTRTVELPVHRDHADDPDALPPTTAWVDGRHL